MDELSKKILVGTVGTLGGYGFIKVMMQLNNIRPMADPVGFEPTTYPLGRGCSIQLSYESVLEYQCEARKEKAGIGTDKIPFVRTIVNLD